MHMTDLFIVNGADPEYTKKTLKLHGESCCAVVYILQNNIN